MNHVPAIFFEAVVSQFFFIEELSCGSDLSGLPGHVVSQANAKWFVLGMFLRNGRLEEESYFNCEHKRVDTETPNRKHLQHIQIAIRADEEEYSTDREAMERVLSVTKGKQVLLSLRTSNISEEIAKCVESIRLVFALNLYHITSDVLKLMRSLVAKNTLNEIFIAKDIEIEDETAQLLVDLFKQKQFHRMYFRGKSCSAALKTIIASWREDSEKMVGKIIYCEEEFSELQLPSTEFPFQECSEEEERDASLA